MPEVSDNAAVFIATSFQALDRLHKCKSKISLCDCLVALSFACFYIEESIDVVLSLLEKTDEMYQYFTGKNQSDQHYKLSMLKKYGWFYAKFIKKDPKLDKKYKSKEWDWSIILTELDTHFTGFKNLHLYRNKIAHGKLHEIVAQPAKVKQYRQLAKDIVSKLLEAADLQNMRKAGYYKAIERVGELGKKD